MGGTELEVLKAVRKKGGEATISAIAAEMRMSSDYTRIVCRSLGMADFIDVFSNGRVRLAEKGVQAVRKCPPEPEESPPVAGEATDGQSEERERPRSREEGFALWAPR